MVRNWEKLLDHEWQRSLRHTNPDGLQEPQRAAERLFYVSADLIPSNQQQRHVPVYVRDSYRGLCEALMERSDTNKYLITGTPRTGKSYFAFYFIRYLLIEYNRGQEVSILYQNCHVDMDYHVVLKRSQNNVRVIEHYEGSRVRKVNYLRGEEHVDWYVFDGWHNRAPLPQSCDGRMIVISSPEYSYEYKEFIQSSHIKLYMPPWKWSEIEEMLSILGYNDTTRNKQAWEYWGGIFLSPNIMPSFGKEVLDDAIGHSNVDTVIDFLKVNGEISEFYHVSHKILHQRPEVRDRKVDYKKAQIGFASIYVMKQFLIKCKGEILKLSSTYESNILAESDTETAMKFVLLFYNNWFKLEEAHELGGYLYELVVHEHIEHNCKYDARYLGMWNGSESSVRTSSIEHLTPKFSKGKGEISARKANGEISICSEELPMQCYLRPSSQNFPAIDSFILTKKFLVLFQVTVNEHHQVVVKDLVRIVHKIEEMIPPEDATLITPLWQNIYLVFIVPERIFKTFKLQQPKPRDCEEALVHYQRIKQFALKFP